MKPMSSYTEKDVLQQLVAMEANVRTVGKFHFITKVCNQKEIYIYISACHWQKRFFINRISINVNSAGHRLVSQGRHRYAQNQGN